MPMGSSMFSIRRVQLSSRAGARQAPSSAYRLSGGLQALAGRGRGVKFIPPDDTNQVQQPRPGRAT